MADVPAWKRNRNFHARLLLQQLRQRKLQAPFTQGPPDGPLPMLPPWLLAQALHVTVDSLASQTRDNDASLPYRPWHSWCPDATSPGSCHAGYAVSADLAPIADAGPVPAEHPGISCMGLCNSAGLHGGSSPATAPPNVMQRLGHGSLVQYCCKDVTSGDRVSQDPVSIAKEDCLSAGSSPQVSNHLCITPCAHAHYQNGLAWRHPALWLPSQLQQRLCWQ